MAMFLLPISNITTYHLTEEYACAPETNSIRSEVGDTSTHSNNIEQSVSDKMHSVPDKSLEYRSKKSCDVTSTGEKNLAVRLLNDSIIPSHVSFEIPSLIKNPVEITSDAGWAIYTYQSEDLKQDTFMLIARNNGAVLGRWKITKCEIINGSIERKY